MEKMPTPIIISIDGNIGAGKTTFLNDLKKKYPEWHFIDEPVDSWLKFKNEAGESLLEVYYKDRKRWSYTFQNCAFLTRVRGISKAIKDWKESCILNPENAKHNIFITERCVDTDYNVFAKMLHEDDSLNLMEWNMMHADIWIKLVCLKLVKRNDCDAFMRLSNYIRQFCQDNDREPTLKEVIFSMDLRE
jgi:deoxyadenosine/deoxycytidine kinase